MLPCHTGKSFEGHRNQICFLTRAGVQLLNAQCPGFVLHETIQSQAVRVGVKESIPKGDGVDHSFG